jgi:REP element-mobilizing transposase RayT
MSIPSLCQACYKHHHATVVNACPFCRDVQFPEAILCDLVRDPHGDEQAFHCSAFRPTLSVVHHDETDTPPTEDSSENTIGMSPKEQWFRAYAVQQLGSNPDLIAFTIRYHVVFSTRQRTNVFSSEHRESMADVVRQSVLPFEQTKAYVLRLASDHLHLYIEASPDYSLDEIVHAIREHLEHEMVNLLPALPHSNQSIWERAYFVEGIG